MGHFYGAKAPHFQVSITRGHTLVRVRATRGGVRHFLNSGFYADRMVPDWT